MASPSVYKQISEVATEYSYSKSPDWLMALQRMIRAFLRYLSDLLARLHIPLGGATDSKSMSNVLLVAVLVLGAICLILVAVWVIVRVRQLKRKQMKPKLSTEAAALLLSSSAWGEEASRLAGERAWKEACRACYFSFLRGLDEKGVLPFSPTRSNFEYYYALSRKSQVAAAFRRLADVVEEEWFGNRVASEHDYEECLGLALQVSALEEKAAAKP